MDSSLYRGFRTGPNLLIQESGKNLPFTRNPRQKGQKRYRESGYHLMHKRVTIVHRLYLLRSVAFEILRFLLVAPQLMDLA